MAKVIQVRNVPDEVHAALVAAAEQSGASLSRYVNDVLAGAAYRLESAEHNRRVIEASQAEFASLDISREEIRRALDAGRAERDLELGDRMPRDRSA